MMMSYDDAGTKPFRRFEVFTGSGRRRSWSEADKAEILAESYAGGESVSAVARRHGLSPGQLFSWRRELKKAAVAPMFVPAIIEVDPQSSPTPSSSMKRRRARRPRHTETAVELEIDGVAVKIARGADAKVIAAMIDALKTAR